MDTTRQHKVARLLQKEMGEILEFEARHIYAESGAMVTLTRVTVTKDLSVARFYLSVFSVNDKPSVVESIRKRSSELRYRLGQRIKRQVRIIPQLEFFEDDSLDYIENIEKLLR